MTDIHKAIRQFERFLVNNGKRSNIVNTQEKQGYHVATITFDHKNKKVVVERNEDCELLNQAKGQEEKDNE